jgi:hypothetical protein
VSLRWLPNRFHTITPNIVVDNAEELLAFFKNACGALVAQIYVKTRMHCSLVRCRPEPRASCR